VTVTLRARGLGVSRFVSAVSLLALAAACSGPLPTGPDRPDPSPIPPDPLPPVVEDHVFVGAGDIGFCGSAGPPATARLLDGILGTVFTAGDNAYPHGSRTDFERCYDPTWGRHKGRTRPTPGNHEYETTGAAPYFNYFGSNAGQPGLGYYSFDLGGWHIVSLNSSSPTVPAGAGSAQVAWLRADLAATPKTCGLAVWHHPLFTSGRNGNQMHMRDVWRVLYEFNVEVVVNGHDHNYERFAPQDPDGRPDPARGIREFIIGTGGAPLYEMRARHPNSEAFVSAYGVLKLTLRSRDYLWQFLPVLGGAFVTDSGTGTCH
jgi:hypothetical protein